MTYSELASRAATRAVLDAHGLQAKYRLGQNFLVDDNIVGRILELAGLSERSADECDDAHLREASAHGLPTVLEVGPGIGTLSVALLACGNVVAIERDDELAPVLEATTAGHAGHFELLCADALDVHAADVRSACDHAGLAVPRMLVANLPYGIAATLVLAYFERMDFLDTMVVMVQSEVADRMCAHVGTKAYGAYSVKLRLHANIVGRFGVAPGCFMPAPHVDSAVVRLERTCARADAATIACACELADAAFAQRRKTVRNSMQGRYEKQLVDELLAACAIDPNVRGETLAPHDFLALARAYEVLRVG